MFCNKKIQNTIDPIQNRSVQIIFSESALNLDELVVLGKDTAIHRKNIITLFAEIFKTTRGEKPSLINRIFSQKQMNYQQAF